MKQRIRLTEGQLHNIIRKCVNETVEEGFGDRVRGAVRGFKSGESELSDIERYAPDLIGTILYSIDSWRRQGIDAERIVNNIEYQLRQEYKKSPIQNYNTRVSD